MRKQSHRNRRQVTKKMTPAALKRFVMKEAAKLSGELEPVEKVEAKEVDADEFANTLEQDIDIYKAMKIQESRMRRQYRKLVREARKVRKNKQLAKKKILRKLK